MVTRKAIDGERYNGRTGDRGSNEDDDKDSYRNNDGTALALCWNGGIDGR